MRFIKIFIPITLALLFVASILALSSQSVQASPQPVRQLIDDRSIIQQTEPVSGFYLGAPVPVENYQLGTATCSAGSWAITVNGSFVVPENNYVLGGIFDAPGTDWKSIDWPAAGSHRYDISTSAQSPSLASGATGIHEWPARIAFMNLTLAIPDVLESTSYTEVFSDTDPGLLDLWQLSPPKDARINNSGVGSDGEGPGGTVYFKYIVNWKAANCLSQGTPPSAVVQIIPVYYGAPAECEEQTVTDIGPTVEYDIVVTDETGGESAVAETEIGALYRLETANGPWYRATPGITPRYDIQIADEKTLSGEWIFRSLSFYEYLHPISTTVVVSGTEVSTETLDLDLFVCPDIDGGYTTIYFQAVTTTLTARVADMPGQFADNSGTMGYKLTEVSFTNPYTDTVLPPGGCSTLGWGITSLWYEFTSTTDQAGVPWGNASVPGGPTQIGQNYMIETTAPWYDNGVESWDAEISHELEDSYTTPDFPDVHCTEQRSDGGYRIFYTAGASAYSLRVHDTDGIWENNTGDPGYAVWNATRYQPPGGVGCIANYRKGILLNDLLVDALIDREAGVNIPNEGSNVSLPPGIEFDSFISGDFYAIEVDNKGSIGPLWLGYWMDLDTPIFMSSPIDLLFHTKSVKLEISDDAGTTWTPLDQYGCGYVYDPTWIDGAVMTFMQAGEGEYRLRPYDTEREWDDLAGTVHVNIYSADYYNFKEYPDCEKNFELGSVIVDGSVRAETREIDEVPPEEPFVENRFYAIETYAGGWAVEGGETLWHDLLINPDKNALNVAASSQSLTEDQVASMTETLQIYSGVIVTSTWTKLQNYPGAACVVETPTENLLSPYVRMYFQHVDGLADQYGVTLLDPTELIRTNGEGTVQYKLYTVTNDPAPVKPPNPGHCDQYFNIGAAIETVTIDADDIDGSIIADSVRENVGDQYVIVVNPSVWYEGDDSIQTDIQFSDDEGNEFWDPLDWDNKLCVEKFSDPPRYNIYFEMMGDDVEPNRRFIARADEKGRKADPDDWIDNTGVMTMTLYGAIPSTVNPPWSRKYPPEIVACSGCVKPEIEGETDSIISQLLSLGSNFSQWINYGTCKVVYFFAFCPWHRNTLMRVADAFYVVEPFATVMEVRDTIKLVKAEYDQYNWDDELSEEEGRVGIEASPIDKFLPTLDRDSIWNEGSIDLTQHVSYVDTCSDEVIPVIGARLGRGLCFGLNILDQIGGIAFFQMMFDLSLIIGFFFYAANYFDR